MTQEEKARAYDEALEKAQKALEVCGTDKCETARQIFSLFPELRESEDERVRKEILSLVQYTKGRKIGYEPRIHQDKMIAWLEKQGAQNKIKALRTEYEKGRADVLRLIDPDEMVADFCSQSLSKIRSIASVYRQGITDVLKRINNNEETSTGRAHLQIK